MKRHIGRRDYISRQIAIKNALGTDNALDGIKLLYTQENLSSVEISEKLSLLGIKLTPRSIQRYLAKLGVIRPIKEAFNLAVKRGRVRWILKDPRFKARRPDLRIAGLRYKVLARDNYKCVLCGNTAKTDILNVDHIIAITEGGKSVVDNLRTLCVTCNIGKRILENEK